MRPCCFATHAFHRRQSLGQGLVSCWTVCGFPWTRGWIALRSASTSSMDGMGRFDVLPVLSTVFDLAPSGNATCDSFSNPAEECAASFAANPYRPDPFLCGYGSPSPSSPSVSSLSYPYVSYDHVPLSLFSGLFSFRSVRVSFVPCPSPPPRATPMGARVHLHPTPPPFPTPQRGCACSLWGATGAPEEGPPAPETS